MSTPEEGAPKKFDVSASTPFSTDNAAPESAPADEAASEKKTTEEPKSELDKNEWSPFRFAVLAVGVVIVLIGLYEVVLGTRSLPDTQNIGENASLESNYRFLAAQFAAVGAAFVAIAIKFEWANMLWFVCAAVFVGGLAQVYSITVSGAPHLLLVVLMVIELAAPPAILVWYQWIVKTEGMKRTLVQGE